ncbi:Tnks [Symbiodinium sp. CCMP2456]|nr:Tnks [Symbiodinium sp. CCMP2456]
MAEQVFQLDIECHEGERSNRIWVPIGGHEPVRRLLEKVRERSEMDLTTLYTLRDGLKALLDLDDTLHLVLDSGENRLRAEAAPNTGNVTAAGMAIKQSSSAEGPEPSPGDAPKNEEEELEPEFSEEESCEAVEGAKRKLDRSGWSSTPVEVGCPRLVKPRTFCLEASSDRESSENARLQQEENKPAPTAIEVESADEEENKISAEGCSAVTDDLPSRHGEVWSPSTSSNWQDWGSWQSWDHARDSQDAWWEDPAAAGSWALQELRAISRRLIGAQEALDYERFHREEKHDLVEETLEAAEKALKAERGRNRMLEDHSKILQDELSIFKEKLGKAAEALESERREHKTLQEKLSLMEEKMNTADAVMEHERSQIEFLQEKHATMERELNATQNTLEVERLAHKLVRSERRTAKEKIQELEAEVLSERTRRSAAEEQLLKLQTQKSSASLGASWQYELDGSWYAFPPEGNQQMNQAYVAFTSGEQAHHGATIVVGSVGRIIDFARMTQQNAVTKKVRNIRICTGVPAQWASPASALLTQNDSLASFYVEVEDPQIFQQVSQILQDSGHTWDVSSPCSCIKTATVKSIHRIENFRLWHRYQARLQAMREDHAKCKVRVPGAALDLDGRSKVMSESQGVLDCGEPLASDVDEKILLHGTSYTNADAIVTEGFDHRTCHRGLYGDGVYFAGAWCKIHQYTCSLHSGKACRCKQERTLIIARVALGDPYYAPATLKGNRRPPNRALSTGTHGSVVVNPGQIHGHHNSHQAHQEFVIFDREQAYPCFVVQYVL